MSSSEPVHGVYAFECLKRYRLPLQRNAHARLLLTRCEALTRYGVRPHLLFRALLQHELYHTSDTGHLSLPLPGVHGPFLTAQISPEDYVEIPHSRWLLQLLSLLQQEKWQLPRLGADEAEKVAGVLQSMFQSQTRVFRLTLCDAFNRHNYPHASARVASDLYQHEWSHALSEFHEYILIDEAAGRCDCLTLSYE